MKQRLAVTIVGDNPASHAYVNSESRLAKECGFKSVQHTLTAETSQNYPAETAPPVEILVNSRALNYQTER
jgi:5,10-methylene-tetrahydrofolate dehydrogenase/methenyl tetrahydrofolate cyclohydrolase